MFIGLKLKKEFFEEEFKKLFQDYVPSGESSESVRRLGVPLYGDCGHVTYKWTILLMPDIWHQFSRSGNNADANFRKRSLIPTRPLDSMLG